jgi:nucleoside 2-deoxyribosyltransferase
MAKIFLGQAVTGEDRDFLRVESDSVCSVLKEKGHDTYCTVLEEAGFEDNSNKDKIRHAFEKLDSYDSILAIVRSDKRSEGLLMEIGYCIAKGKQIIVAMKNGVKNTYLHEIADKVIEFEDIDDLLNKLKELEL